MIATTPKSMTLTKRGLVIFVTLAFAFCMALAMGAAPAYAEDDNSPAPEDNASEAASNPSSPQLDAEMPTVGAAASDNAPAALSNDSDGPSGDISLGAAGDSAYPGDDRTMNAFIGLVPETTPSYNAESAVRDSETNALHVYLSSEVGKGVDLDVAVDYIRIGENVYDASGGIGVTAQLPSATTDAYTMTSFKQGLMYTWYINGSPLGQGTYYSDPSTNPALGGGSVGSSLSLTSYSGVEVEDFMLEKSTQWGVSPSSYTNNTPVRFIKSVPYAYYPFDGSIELLEINKGHDETGAFESYRYASSPLFFESSGTRTIVAQFTYMQEYRSRNGASENVGYVVYASNPVIFHISIAPASPSPADLTVVAGNAETGDPVDISGNDFIVDLEKDYLDEYRMADENGGTYEWLRYAFCSTSGNTYACATPGLYRLTVTHVDNLYQQYIEYFKISEGMVSGGSFNKPIVLEPYVPPAQYSVTFYQEDGVTVIPVSGTDESGNYVTVDSRMYNEGTVAERVWAPPHPTKAATEYAKYVFEQWRAEAADGGAIDTFVSSYDYVYPVTCNTKYIAVFRTIPLKNNAGQSIVYATGGLFSNDALPSGVLSYGMTSKALTETEESGIIAGHSGMIAPERVLGMVQVDLTQYNDDEGNTTTNVTEHDGLKGMSLEFDMGDLGIDVEDGANLKVLQIHKKDESSPEEIITHEATVEGGKVSLTLDGKLSTFVFMMADPYPGDDGTQENFLGLVPTSDFEYEVDENGTIHVYLESNVGKSLDLDVNLNYFRRGETVYDARESDKYVPIGNDMHEQDGAMICWYVGDAPLPQGVYSTSLDQRLPESAAPVIGSGYDAGGLSDSTGLVQYDVTAFNYLFSFFGDGDNGWRFEIPNRICAYVMNTQTTHGEPWDLDVEYAFFLDSDKKGGYILSARYNPQYLLFTKAGTYTFTAQASYAVDTVTDILDPVTEEPFVDEFGNTYQRVDYTFYMSFPVVFHITVGEAPAAKLLLSATDGVDDVALDSNFKIELYKQLEDESFALCSSTSSYEGATAGAYKLKVTSKYGTYEPKEVEFSLTIDEIEAAGEVDPSVSRAITLTAIPDPPQFTIVFTNFDDAVLSTAQYNENTLSEAVVVPTDLTKPEDDDFTYKFVGWETEQDGEMVRTNISNVTSDKVYRAAYQAISKDVVSNSTIRVYASGGLFGQPRPEGVEKHELVVTEPSESEKAGLIEAYKGTIGSRVVDGVYVVDIIQHRMDGDSVSLTEDVGDVVLTFPTALAEGTRANVYQLHKLSNGGTVVIEHNNLMVVGGSIDVPLDGRLSTFIITTAEEKQSVDPENGGGNGNNGDSGKGSASGESGNGAAGGNGTPTEGSEKGSGGQEKAESGVSGDSAADSDKPLTEGVKAALTAGDANLPATGDPLGALALTFVVMAFAAAAACALRFRRDR